MDLSATQIYEDDDFPSTQKISHALEEEESVQVGTLTIDSTEYPIKTGTTKIGRHGSDIIINDVAVSKLHAEIEASGRQGSTWISDLKSSNRTKLNNLTLRPTRLYELKDGSVIEFGRVRAIYRTFNPGSDMIIPETPAPLRRKVSSTIIPNTPDSSLNSSSGIDEEGSIILGTQKDENSVFRQPRISQRHKFTSIDKKNTSMNKSNDSQIVLNASDNDIQNQISIFEVETQKFEFSNCIHDTETQEVSTNISKHLVEANAKIDKQLPKLSVDNKTVGKSMINIHDIETQNYINNINEIETGKSKINIQNIIEKKSDEGGSNAQKSEIAKSNLAQIDIHDLETQKFNNECNAKNIYDLETQLELDGIARCEQSRDISDMETQYVADNTVNKTNNDQANKNKDTDSIVDTTKDRTNHKNMESSKSRSNSPESLNLSSPGIESCSSSPLNQSSHLLEESYLSEFFGDGIDKQDKQMQSNMFTPKSLTKVSSKRNNNAGNSQNVNNEETNDEDIFEAPTQCISSKFTLMSGVSETNKENALLSCQIPKKNHEKSRSKQANDDSDTDAEEYVAELAEKQHESSETLNEISNKNISNKNDLGTSIESEDIFDALTQQLDNPVIKDTSDSSINQPEKTDEINRAVDNVESTQIIDNVDEEDRINMPDNNATSNQLTLSHEASKTVINKQVIGEIEDKEKRNFICEKDSSQICSNDTLEQKLNEMFDNANNDTNNDANNREIPHMSTQCLEDILESSQRDDSNKSIAGNRDTNSVSRKQLKKNHASYNQHSHNLNTKVNVNNVNKAETDSQNSDVYFSTITTKQKRNILKDTQEFIGNVTHSQNVNCLQTSKVDNERAMNDNIAVKFNKRNEGISEAKNKSDTIIGTLNNDRNNTISNGNNKRNLRSSNSTRQKDETSSEMNQQVLRKDPIKFEADDAEKNPSICTPYPSTDGQRVQMLDTLYENDDDILIRLPAVRISGTLSNPASPSASSTSSVRSTRSKQDIAKKKKHVSLRGKSRKQNVANSRKKDKPSVSHSNVVSNIPMIDTSEDSETDTETKYKRFQQMADRMLGNEPGCLKQQDKEQRKNIHVSPDLKQNTDVKSKALVQINSRMTRHSSRQNDNTRNRQKEARVKNTTYKDRSTELETNSTVTKRKASPNIMEQITSKKRKAAQITKQCLVSTRSRTNIMKTTTDRQSPNVLENSPKISRGNSPIIENTKSSEDNKAVFKTTSKETQMTSLNMKTDGNINLERSNIRQTRHMIFDKQIIIHVNNITANENNKKNKSVQTKEAETQANQLQEKIPRVLLGPIKNLDDGSQEVERIMAKGLNNTQDKNLSIRESSKAKIFQRKLRRRKRSYSDTETDSILIESGMSSEIGESDNTQFDDSGPSAKREKSAKNSVSSLSEAQVSKKKKTFKKSISIKNSTNSTLDSSTEDTIGESSQSNTENNASIISRVSRSKAANIRNEKKMELNQNMHRLHDENTLELNTSIEIMSLSTPSRMRRNTSVLSNSTLCVIKHKVLFTGIMEDYSKIIKTLGGNKVEDPTKCTILVTDKIRRTYKFLCTLAKGIPIVAIDWLSDSETAGRFLDWENYILKDPVSEAKFGFRLRKSLDKAKEKRLLDGYIVVLTPSIAPPPIQELKDIILACGGKALLRPPTKWPEKAVVLSREEDLPNARKFLAKAPKTVTVQSTEFILTGILKQETDFDKYKLI